MTASAHAYFTPDEYLDLERLSPIKHEYLQGQVVAMAGASKAHVIITGNLSARLIHHLRGTGCIAYATDMKVRIPTLNVFYYPDLAVTCDQRDLNDAAQDFILHPKLIIEVLSDTTESFDRGEKFADYKAIAEFEEYILIHQQQMTVEQFLRRSPTLWVPQVYRGEERLELASIGLTPPPPPPPPVPWHALYENVAQLQ